jgi:uncharacterized peroxidase-related enzyme
MTLISTVPPEQATGSVAETYRQIKESFGWIPNTFQMASVSPAQLEMTWQSVNYYFTHPSLSAGLLATTRMLVSDVHDCAYCVDFNAAILINRCDQTAEQVAATRLDPTQAPLAPKDKAMLMFALKAVDTPHDIAASDLDALRALGWTDRDMFDAVAHAARNVAADILFNTFKIERDF